MTTVEKCDECGHPMMTKVCIFQRRPSDRTDLCAILWICGPCARNQGWQGARYTFDADEVPSVATYAQAERWIEEYGQFRREDPVLFVT